MEKLLNEIEKKAVEKKSPLKSYVSLTNHLYITHYKRLICLAACKEWFEYLNTVTFPEETKIKLAGKMVKIPRQQIAFGDVDFKYNGIIVTPKKWTKRLLKLKKVLEKLTRNTYNFVLLNKYRDGNDYISYHKDNDKDLDLDAPIVSVSFGMMREFAFKHDDDSVDEIKMNLMDGDVVVIHPPTNKYWKHSILKKENSVGVRYNLTFRKIR